MNVDIRELARRKSLELKDRIKSISQKSKIENSVMTDVDHAIQVRKRKIVVVKRAKVSRPLAPIFSKIRAAQENKCYLCGYDLSNPNQDHVVPKAKGGKNAYNILATHPDCNVSKSDRAPYPCEILYLQAINEIVYGVKKVVDRNLVSD